MKTRIISGTVGIIIFIAAIFAALKIDTLILNALLVVIGAIGVYEMLKTTGYVKSKFLLISALVYVVAASLVYSSGEIFGRFGIDFNISGEVCTVIFAVVIFAVSMFCHKDIKPLEVAFAFGMTVAITFAFWSLAAIFGSADGNGLFYLIIVVIAAWGSDTGAYFTGYFFGKHKMAPEISPKKTVEGAVGGIVVDVLLMFAACMVFNKVSDASANIPVILGLTPVLALSGMVGDLIFSYIKRDCGIKDYGKLMPGHGGVLDRFDSVALVAPLMYIAMSNLPLVG